MISDYVYIYPELWLALLASMILLGNAYYPTWNRRTTYLLCQITLLGAAYWTSNLLAYRNVHLLNDTFVVDGVGNLLKMSIYFVAIFVFMYSKKYLQQQQIYRGEYYVLCLYSILGMMVLISASSFLSLYLGLELLTLPLYALICICKNSARASEAAMKYFVMGALTSGMFLYGISLLYGVTGSFTIAKVALSLALEPKEPQLALLLGLMFTLMGLAFKLGVVPFHMWLPDVYEGAPTSMTLFIGTLTKLAGLGFAIRLLVDTFPAFNAHWQQIFIVMIILSLALGNITALTQTNIKRLLAYSTIGHMGFVFLGLLAGPEAGFSAALLYMIIYALMALAAFGMIIALSHQGFEAEELQDFRGLGARQPWVAFLMMLVLLSLAGIPPLAGFYAKFVVLDAAITAGYTWLALIAVIFTVIGAVYYLKIIRLMFFEAPMEGTTPCEIVSPAGRVLLSINSLALLALGLFPSGLFKLCQRALLLD